MSENIIIISHRRSGTHLSIDSIRNNILPYKYNDFLVLNENNLDSEKFTEFCNIADKKNNVIKTHFLPDFKLYSADNEQITKLNKLFSNSFLIYVYRNGLDVMVSLYEYMKKFNEEVNNLSFEEFLETNNNFDNTEAQYKREEFWKYHIQEWKNYKLKDNIMWIKYEDFITNYEGTISEICENFKLTKAEKITDIRIQNTKSKNSKIDKIKNILKGVKKTSVSARKGIIGDYKNYYSTIKIDEFLSKNKNFLNELGYNLQK
ncbi:MAG: sulfotransferase domain-containing protein [Bacteroidales bacterium]|nr:sulfotransferase domain-containing protein [Bacteroidales bacterium]